MSASFSLRHESTDVTVAATRHQDIATPAAKVDHRVVQLDSDGAAEQITCTYCPTWPRQPRLDPRRREDVVHHHRKEVGTMIRRRRRRSFSLSEVSSMTHHRPSPLVTIWRMTLRAPAGGRQDPRTRSGRARRAREVVGQLWRSVKNKDREVGQAGPNRRVPHHLESGEVDAATVTLIGDVGEQGARRHPPLSKHQLQSASFSSSIRSFLSSLFYFSFS